MTFLSTCFLFPTNILSFQGNLWDGGLEDWDENEEEFKDREKRSARPEDYYQKPSDKRIQQHSASGKLLFDIISRVFFLFDFK